MKTVRISKSCMFHLRIVGKEFLIFIIFVCRYATDILFCLNRCYQNALNNGGFVFYLCKLRFQIKKSG